jgi:peptide/nickel transport system permease protein
MSGIRNPRLKGLVEALLFNAETKLGFLLIMALVVAALIIAIGGIRVLPFDPIQQNVGAPLAPPDLRHPFGTDMLGRDVFSRVAFATPNDLLISFVVVGSSLVVGTALGITAAYRGGLLDEALMRTTDVIFAIPALVLAMSIAVILGPSVIHMMYSLMIIWWPPYARLARGEALRVSQYNFVEAAKASGSGTLRILRRHIFPNIVTPMLAYATIDLGSVVLIYAGLSYLGLSVRPPIPEWGAMVSAYQDYLVTAPWLPLFPALIIGIVVVAFSLLGDGLRDAAEAASMR